MRDKKETDSEKTPEEQALERHVDAMMDPKRPDEDPAEDVPEPKDEKAEPEPGKPVPHVAEPVEDTKTAPQLSAKLRKKIGVDDKSAAPLSIDKLDELAESIVDPEFEPKPEPESGSDKPEVDSDSEADPEPDPETPPEPTPDSSTELDDTRTDEAVDDIVAHEGDVMLAVQDATAAARSQKVRKPSGSGWKHTIKALLKNKWTWIIVAAIIVILFAVPATRYKLIGLVVKEPVSMTVVDSKTNTPVSGAIVDIAGRSAKTDADGRTTIKAPPGDRTVTITKKYYKTAKTSLFIGLKATASRARLQATGRQVPIVVTNKITGKPLAGAEITVLGTTAKTDKQGKAIVVLPTTSSKAAAAIGLKGYNTAKASVVITNQAVSANSFALTPAGTVYFLSNSSGTIDVVKTDLDGSNRHTVLEGTGHEDASTTSLLASRDWRYLVLKARRDTAQPALYLIDTSNDKVSQFDSGDSTFKLIGWSGHSFIYDITRNNTSLWQSGREVLKSYDADNRQLNQLDQVSAVGDASSYAYQNFANFYILGNVVVYNTQWYDGDGFDLSGKTDTIRAVQPNGQNKKDYQSFPADTTAGIQAAPYEPQGVYYAVYDTGTGQTSYYEYENQSVKTVADIGQGDFSKSYPTYLFSPSGSQTFWTELRDGRDSLFVGGPNAQSPKEIATLSGYTPYGWYGNTYVLVSKNSSELYIMAAGSSGSGSSAQPLKITDYYKPAQTYSGYGYGYGGL